MLCLNFMSHRTSHFAPRLSMFFHFKFNGEKGVFLICFINGNFFIFVLGYVGFYVNMSNRPSSVDAKAFRDAIVDCHLGKAQIRNVPQLYHVTKRQVMNAIEQLRNINRIREQFGQSPLLETSNRMQVFRWASKYANVHIIDGTTDYEKRHSLLLDAQGMKIYEIYKEYGVGEAAHHHRQERKKQNLF